jgi:hypothetical protein
MSRTFRDDERGSKPIVLLRVLRVLRGLPFSMRCQGNLGGVTLTGSPDSDSRKATMSGISE